MRVLITGISGFVGSHLAEFAVSRGAHVIGALRGQSSTRHIAHLQDRMTLVRCDLGEPRSVCSLVEQAQPDFVFHLAAQSFVSGSWQTPAETLYTNAIGQMNLLEAMRRQRARARFLVIGSSEEYGLVERDELPVRETNALRPLSPYAVSKVTQDLMGWQYFKSYGMHIVRARAFNHTGPRCGANLATSSFAKQIAEIEVELRKAVVQVGDLRPARDFSDVRDIVRGYWRLLEDGTPGEVYNLCSGRDWSIERVVQFLLSRSKASHIEVRVDPARLRPSEVPVLQGSADRIRDAVGWYTTIPLEQTLTDLLEYWRERLHAGSSVTEAP